MPNRPIPCLKKKSPAAGLAWPEYRDHPWSPPAVFGCLLPFLGGHPIYCGIGFGFSYVASKWSEDWPTKANKRNQVLHLVPVTGFLSAQPWLTWRKESINSLSIWSQVPISWQTCKSAAELSKSSAHFSGPLGASKLLFLLVSVYSTTFPQKKWKTSPAWICSKTFFLNFRLVNQQPSSTFLVWTMVYNLIDL